MAVTSRAIRVGYPVDHPVSRAYRRHREKVGAELEELGIELVNPAEMPYDPEDPRRQEKLFVCRLVSTTPRFSYSRICIVRRSGIDGLWGAGDTPLTMYKHENVVDAALEAVDLFDPIPKERTDA